jgi:hypothetical protein
MECGVEAELNAGKLEEITPNMTGEHGTQLLTMESENPCRRTMASKNTLVTEVAV